MGADAAEGGGGDGFGGAVVEDQGCARGTWFRRGGVGGRGRGGRGGFGGRRSSADSVGKVRSVGVRFRGDFDEGGRVFEERGVAGRERGNEE